ncbi:MAG: RNA polymerase sigma factor, partial [bacterium]
MGKFKNKIILIKLNLKDEKTFAEVYDLYIEKIYRFIFFKVSNVRDAEDLTSEVFLKAWQYINEGKKIKSVNAFLYAIARNKVIDHYRKNSKIKTVDLENDGIEKIKSADPHPDEGLDRKLAMDDINKFLNELKVEYKEALLLKYTDDFSIGEI